MIVLRGRIRWCMVGWLWVRKCGPRAVPACPRPAQAMAAQAPRSPFPPALPTLPTPSCSRSRSRSRSRSLARPLRSRPCWHPDGWLGLSRPGERRGASGDAVKRGSGRGRDLLMTAYVCACVFQCRCQHTRVHALQCLCHMTAYVCACISISLLTRAPAHTHEPTAHTHAFMNMHEYWNVCMWHTRMLSCDLPANTHELTAHAR